MIMIINFFKNAANLKKVQRRGWVDKLGMTNPESVADHSFSMAVMGMVLSDVENYNSEKIIKMVLLHDLAESKVGDYTPGQISLEKKKELENNAFLEIAKDLPDSIRSAYLEIWQEYQENNSAESSIVHQLDKLEMALQAKIYQNKAEEGHTKERLESFYESARKEINDPKLKELFGNIMEDN